MVGALMTLPVELQTLIGEAEWQDVMLGMSGAKVYRLTTPDHQRYLKIAPLDDAEVTAEKDRLEWLQGRLPVPRVLYYGADETQHYLLVSAVPGVPASDDQFNNDGEKLVRLLALGLQTLHKLENCPFDARLDIRIEQAHQRMMAGLVNVDHFDEERRDFTPQNLYEKLVNTRPQSDDLVFTHGDYCFENVILEVNPRLLYLRGFIDWGRAGLADRYQDLALAAREIKARFGAEMVNIFFEAYGEGVSPDDPRVEYYQLLDEFF